MDAALTEICANATVNYDNAIIDFPSQKQMDRQQKYIDDPTIFTNSETEDCHKQFQKSVTYAVGTEVTKTKWHGWSTSGGLSATYQGVGATAAVGYERGKAEASTLAKNEQRQQTFDECILVPSETRVKVAIEKQFMVLNCKVCDLRVTFKKNKSQVKCKVQFGQKCKIKNETFSLKDVFKNDIASSNQKGITVRMNGKYTWSETSVYLRRFDPEPLQGLDIM